MFKSFKELPLDLRHISLKVNDLNRKHSIEREKIRQENSERKKRLLEKQRNFQKKYGDFFQSSK